MSEPQGDWGWRSTEIDTTEGTWMGLDVSPDGRFVVFDLLGDIYEIPIEGGDARALRTGKAWTMQPRYSPDGAYIAFTSDEGGGDNLWIMSRDGSEARAITKESFRLVNNPSWEPSGQWVVAKKHFTSKRSLGAGEMWLYHISGGSGLQLTERPTEQKDVNDPAFSPDGRYLYFDRDATPGRFFEYNKDSTRGIYVIERLDRSTGEIVEVTGGPGGAARPTPSPDGRKLAFVRRVDYSTHLFVKELESGEERSVVADLDRDNQEVWALHGVYPGMAWTPDGRSIVYWAQGALNRVDVETGATARIPFRVEARKQVAQVVRPKQTVSSPRFPVRMLRSVSLSPSGDRVAYVALGQVYVKDLPDGEPRRLTRDSSRFEHDPTFTPDGRSIVFATWSDRELGDLRIASTSGAARPRVLTSQPGHYAEPVVSPDGATLVFRRLSGGWLRDPRYTDDPGIYRMSLRGGPQQKLTGRGEDAHFGARSDRLYFMRSKSEETKDIRSLVRLDLERLEERVLVRSEGAQAFRVSPDDAWLAFRDGFSVHVAALPDTGRTVDLAPDHDGLPVARLSRDAGADLSWRADATSLLWSLGPSLHERPLAEAFAFLRQGGRSASAEADSEVAPSAPVRTIEIGFEADAAIPQTTFALVGARVVTMNGSQVLPRATVVVEGERIKAVGPDVVVPPGAFVVDVSGKTIVPGFIDAHAHGAQGTDGIIPQHNWGQYANLAFGVTTIHDPSNVTGTVFAASEMQRAGLIRAPRIFSTGRILYGAAGADYKAKIETLDDARFHLARMKAVGAFSVKSYNQPRRDQRQKVLTAARELGMQVMPEGGATFMHNLTMLVDGHTTIEHNLPVEHFYDDVRQLWAESDVAITPTLVVAYGGLAGERYWYQHDDVWKHPRLTRFVPRFVVDPRARRREKAPEGDYNHIQVAADLATLVRAGKLVNTGGHGQMAGLAEHWEMWMFAQGGMTALEVLRAATLSPAKTLGMDDEIGSVEVGKLADLVVLDENPLEDIRNTDSVRMVMVGGFLYDASTMDRLGPVPDEVGSMAFGDGPNALGIGRWWGSVRAHAHTSCSCGAGS